MASPGIELAPVGGVLGPLPAARLSVISEPSERDSVPSRPSSSSFSRVSESTDRNNVTSRPASSSVSVRTTEYRPSNSTEDLTAAPPEDEPLKASTSAYVISSVAGITAISSMLAGVITVAIPTIAKDIGLPHSLLLWPASIFALVSGCTLLLSGSATDVFGSRTMYLLGCAAQCAFVLACGLSRTGTEMIVFRGLSGLANSTCLPSATSIITNAFSTGKRRNVAFASMGGGQPIGFAIGLTLGGVLTDTIGWRWSFYLGAILTAIVGLLAALTVPKDEKDRAPIAWSTLVKDIDWIGALIISVSLAGLSYVLSSITTSTTQITEPLTATIFAISLLLLPAFSLWVHRQVHFEPPKPALIPNKLWTSMTFTSLNLSVFLIWGAFNALEQLMAFYFQYVQKLTALQSALRFLPEAVSGVVTNTLMGSYFVRKVRADRIVVVSALICLISPLLMALASGTDSYWVRAFPAIILNPVGADCLFTISNLVITDVFPKREHGLAGGVFNTVAQIGKSIGLALSGVIANTITAQAAGRGAGASTDAENYTPGELMQGYRAAFWFMFAVTVSMIPIAGFGLRRVGKVGEKKD